MEGRSLGRKGEQKWRAGNKGGPVASGWSVEGGRSWAKLGERRKEHSCKASARAVLTQAQDTYLSVPFL